MLGCVVTYLILTCVIPYQILVSAVVYHTVNKNTLGAKKWRGQEKRRLKGVI